MNVVFHSSALKQLEHWAAHDPRIAAKIRELIADIRRHPFIGLGKPEPLRGNLKGWWSRRITGEHRLVYRVTGTGATQVVEIAQCRFHY